MSYSTKMRSLQLCAAGALLLAAGVAQAQWMWVDAKGLKQVSDRPPPASVASKDIIKAPPGAVRDVSAAEAEFKAAPPALPTVAAAPTKGLSLAEREADYRKRTSDKAEADKKAAEDAAKLQNKANACKAAQADKAALDSGVRIRTGAGRSEFMSDEARRERTASTARFMAEHCQ